MITQARLKEVISYDREIGEFTWRVSLNNSIKVGNAAGTLDQRGYLCVRIDKKRYMLHRLVWLYIHGKLPEYEIDNINHIRSDNRLINLRGVTRATNSKNRSRLKIIHQVLLVSVGIKENRDG